MPQSAEAIRRQMRQVRRELGVDMDEIVESTRELTDWRAYVKRYPWFCLGAAAAVGFLIVPKSVELVSPDADALLELAKNNKLVVKTNPQPQARSGLVTTAISFLASAALRSAIAHAGQQFGKISTEKMTDGVGDTP